MNEPKSQAIISLAEAGDAAAILALQKLAYMSEASIYDDFGIPPLVETVSQLEQAFNDHLILKAEHHGVIIGSVRGRLADETCHVTRLIVHPEHQGHGLGYRLMLAVEAGFPLARRAELFTGAKSTRPLSLYAKLGYRAFRRQPQSEKVELVFLEKVLPVKSGVQAR